MALPIEDYAIIGDCKTAALVGRDGSIDWLCWPRFELGSVLRRSARNFPERLISKSRALSIRRRYRSGTLILETEFHTETGSAKIVDFMPPADGPSELVRIVVGLFGRVTFQTELVVRFDHVATVPWVTRIEDGAIDVITGRERLVLRTSTTLYGEDLKTVGEFTVDAVQTVPLILSYGPSFETPPAPIDPVDARSKSRLPATIPPVGA